MTSIGPIPNPLSRPPAVAGVGAEDHSAPPAAGRTDDPRDRIDWSPQVTDDLPAPDIEERIADIRARIADGTYETPDKIDVVVQRLLEQLREP